MDFKSDPRFINKKFYPQLRVDEILKEIKKIGYDQIYMFEAENIKYYLKILQLMVSLSNYPHMNQLTNNTIKIMFKSPSSTIVIFIWELFGENCSIGGSKMDMRIGIVQEQSLTLNMTQEIRQAIALLQYSSAELASYIQDIAMDNPLIEVKETAFSNKMTKQSNREINGAGSFLIENVSKENISLEQHLRSQLVDMKLSPKEKRCLFLLIHGLDSNGYLQEDISQLAENINVPEKFLGRQLLVLQSLEPAGVGARSLQECILLQLRRLQARNMMAEEIITHYFELFAKRSWKQLSGKLNISLNEIQDIHDQIKMLDPRPGLKYENTDTTYVRPDMSIRINDDELHIYYHDEMTPEVKISSDYKQYINKTIDKEFKSYVSRKIQQCKWLEKSLQQRKETMLKVMKVIAYKQMAFFKKGKAFLKPLTLKDVAKSLQIHESTVSRAIKDKYVQTPQGLVEMKFFFSTNIDPKNEQNISSATVKERIAELILHENKNSPLSDQKIANLLQNDYRINISRRTVAKYRAALNIASSVKRKEYER